MEEITEIMDTTTPDEKMYEVVNKLSEALKLLEEGSADWPSWEDAVRPLRIANQASMSQNIVDSIIKQLRSIESACDFKATE